MFPKRVQKVYLKSLLGECYSASGVFQVIGACLRDGKNPLKGLIGKRYLINCFDFESNYASLVVHV